MTRRIARYALGRAALGVATAAGLISSLVLLINLVELSRALGGRGEAEFALLLQLALLESPHVALQLSPFAILFGVMGAFVSMNRRNELVAMRAAGMSAWGFVLPTALAAALAGIVAVTLINPASTALKARYETRKAALTEGASRPGDQWIRRITAGGDVILHARAAQAGPGRPILDSVDVFVRRRDPDGGLRLDQRLTARHAEPGPSGWRLSGVTLALPTGQVLAMDNMDLDAGVGRGLAVEALAPASAIGVWDLGAAISGAKQSGFSARAYELRLAQLTATPLRWAAMALVAAAFSLRLLRLGDLALLLAGGVGLGFGLYFLEQLFGALGLSGSLPIWIAAWTPSALALLSAVTLLCFTEDG